MKKYITLTALFAAGSVFSNAAVIALDDTVKESPIIATSLLDVDGLTAIISQASLNTALLGIEDNASNNWSISVGTWNGTNELHIYNVAAGSSISGNAPASFSDPEGSWPVGHKLNTVFTNLNNAVQGAITLGYAGNNVDQDTSGTAVVFSVLYDDGTVKTIYGIKEGQKYSSNSIVKVSYAEDYLKSPSVTTTVTWDRDSLIAANLAALPEPSAFGLLAGAGALALAAARRRRRKA